MTKLIYVERSIREHARTIMIYSKFPTAKIIEIEHYGEVFNRNNQSFRIQKNNPALILARKKNSRVLPVPKGLEVEKSSYYFSHMLNCIYDCRYCFLQGMFRSSNYVIFVNYEDFQEDIMKKANDHNGQAFFFSGYDCDSLAMDPVTNFTESFLPIFKKLKHSKLELRTKSSQIRSLLQIEPQFNVVCSFSLNPEEIINLFEQKTPSLKTRIECIKKLSSVGWKIGLRFDPIIVTNNFKKIYEKLFFDVFSNIQIENIDSITVGTFRLSSDQYKRMTKDRPDEWLYQTINSKPNSRFGYHAALDKRVIYWTKRRLENYAEKIPIFVQQPL